MPIKKECSKSTGSMEKGKIIAARVDDKTALLLSKEANKNLRSVAQQIRFILRERYETLLKKKEQSHQGIDQ